MKKKDSVKEEPDAESPAPGKTGKRRPHSKSRRGCLTCKRRRVKCDETHPVCKNCEHLGLECSFAALARPEEPERPVSRGALNMMDLRLLYHYTTEVWKTITRAGVLNDEIWGSGVPMLAFDYPFLMHAILTFSATHLSRTHQGIPSSVVTMHRGDALRLLREEVRRVTPQNLDALVAASILLILDSLANAALPDSTNPSSLPASAWLHHVRGAATILLSVGPLPPESRFYQLVNIDLGDLAEVVPSGVVQYDGMSSLECFDEELKNLYPVHTASPYFATLAYLDKLFHQRYKSDFILRVFSFPALLDSKLIELLVRGDDFAKKIIKVYYRLVRSYTAEMKERVWFLEGVASVLPIDMDAEYGGLSFITHALPVNKAQLDEILQGFNASISAAEQQLSPTATQNKYEPTMLRDRSPSSSSSQQPPF